MSTKELHSGWLTKRGAVRRNWKQRWFVVYADKTMKYFETGKKEKALGTIDLKQVLSISPCDEKGVRPNSLSLTTQDRVWVLAAENADSLEKWLHTLEVCVGTAKRLVTTKEGFLMKKGKVNTSWKTRYFALGKGWLFYFAQEEDCQKFKKIAFFSEKVFRLAFFKYVSGSIPLEQAVIERYADSRTRITISTPQRVYHIIAKSERELEQWIQAIHKSVEKFKGQKSPKPRAQQDEDDEEEEYVSHGGTQKDYEEMAAELNRQESKKHKSPESSSSGDNQKNGDVDSSLELEEKRDSVDNGYGAESASPRLSKLEFESDDENDNRKKSSSVNNKSPKSVSPKYESDYDSEDNESDGGGNEDTGFDGLPAFPSLKEDNTSDFVLLRREDERDRQTSRSSRADGYYESDSERSSQSDEERNAHKRNLSLLEEIEEEKNKQHRKRQQDEAEIYYKKVKKGIVMLKHGRKGSPHERLITVDRDKGFISWGSGSDQKIDFQNITAVSAGKTTEVFARSAHKVNDDFCFSLVTGIRTLDLQADSKKARDDFVKMLRAML